MVRIHFFKHDLLARIFFSHFSNKTYVVGKSAPASFSVHFVTFLFYVDVTTSRNWEPTEGKEVADADKY